MTTGTLTFDERGLAQKFLMEAFDALLASGDPQKLGITGEEPRGDTLHDKMAAMVTAHQLAVTARMEFARTAVLSTALGVEAAANYYIAAALPDNDALEDLKTVNQLLVAPQLATGEAFFATGKEPIGQIRTLFKLRNRIVHPKVGKHAIVGEAGIADFTPRAAGECLIAAAQTMKILAAALPDSIVLPTSGADLILSRQAELRAAARQWTEGLPKPKALRRAPAITPEATTPDATEEAGE